MNICVAVSSIGRTGRLHGLLESLAEQSDKFFTVGICDQSTNGSVAEVAESFRGRLDLFVTSSPRGLSRGRNLIVQSAPDDVSHFIFPNDTSRLPATTIADLKYRHAGVDIIALSYINDGDPRYTFPAGHYDLDAANVWKIIEPAMVLSRRALELAEGFDEDLGAGSSTLWQSGEGTDLLLKLRGRNLSIAWDPELQVLGVPEEFGLTRTAHLNKLRGYGRGYGCIHRKWSYPLGKKIRICVAPWIKAAIPNSGIGVQQASAISLGRVEGLLGRRLGKSYVP